MGTRKINYLEWARRNMGRMRYDLACSNVKPLPVEELGLRAEDIKILRADEEGNPVLRELIAERYGVHSPALLTVLEKMEATIEAPLTRRAMARLVGVSERHLQRLFSNHMQSTFVSEYRRIRLEHANRLLRESPLPVSEIAVATGFSSAAHFSRSFSGFFGMTPTNTRKHD